MTNPTLKAEVRKITGRKVKALRKEGILPANIYGKKIKSQSVQVNIAELQKIHKDVGETGLVEIEIGKEKKPVLIHNIQKDPVTGLPIHADLLQVDLKEKVTANVHVELEGESPAEKQGIGTVVLYINEIEVKALPGDLPEKFFVDASSLSEVDQSVLIKDLPIDKEKVEIITSGETIVAKVEPPQKEEEIAPPPAPEGEVPAEGETPKEGEVPAEAATTETPGEVSGETPKEEDKKA